MLGDTGCGKTSLVLRFAEGYYRDAPRSSTVGAFFITKRIQTSNGITCKIQIWDTAGQAQFRPMAPMYYRNAAAAIVCYDVSSAQSFKVMREWLDELHRNVAAGSIVIAIAATKCDLISSIKPAVPMNEAEELAQALSAIFVDTSAKENYRITELFQRVAERVLKFREIGKGELPVTSGASIDKNGIVINGDKIKGSPIINGSDDRLGAHSPSTLRKDASNKMYGVTNGQHRNDQERRNHLPYDYHTDNSDPAGEQTAVDSLSSGANRALCDAAPALTCGMFGSSNKSNSKSVCILS